ncbi:Sulfotransferase domain - like 10 [Theobroma cacao]|nr:Sulfotransferase domain - like 10 [Theobroma cacao]
MSSQLHILASCCLAYQAALARVPQDKEEPWDDDEFQELVQTLPKEKGWYGTHLYFYQGFWCSSRVFRAMISFQKHFQALDSDIFLKSIPKSGTTWLKALTFSISFEFDLYLNNPCPDLENSCPYQPRMFSTHLPYASLSPSIKDSNSKIVYICRNPMDMFISLWFFTDKLRPENVEPLSLNEAFEKFCQGIHGFGPFFDHEIGAIISRLPWWSVSRSLYKKS